MAGNDPVQKFKSITVSLQNLIECPVCLEPTKLPIKQCATGHIVCGKCADRLLKGCPSCRQPFTLENPIGYKKLLEALPRLCKNSDLGCPEVLGCDDNEHETYCGHRLIKCIQIGCSDNIKINEIFDHMKMVHKANVFCNGGIMITENALSYYSKQQFSNTPIEVLQNCFWLYEEYDFENKQLKLVFKVAPIGKPTEDYFMTIEFLNGNDFKLVYTLKAFCYVENSHIEPSVEEGTCMTVPRTLLMNFVKGNKLKWSIKSFKRAK